MYQLSKSDLIIGPIWSAKFLLARGLRWAADKLSEDTRYRVPGLNMRFVKNEGVKVSWRHTGAPGVPLFYRADEYHLAFTPEGDYYDK